MAGTLRNVSYFWAQESVLKSGPRVPCKGRGDELFKDAETCSFVSIRFRGQTLCRRWEAELPWALWPARGAKPRRCTVHCAARTTAPFPGCAVACWRIPGVHREPGVIKRAYKVGKDVRMLCLKVSPGSVRRAEYSIKGLCGKIILRIVRWK